jgi:hypothetical protein
MAPSAPEVAATPGPGAPAAPLHETPFPDGSGSIGLPDGWTITGAHADRQRPGARRRSAASRGYADAPHAVAGLTQRAVAIRDAPDVRSRSTATA